MRRFSRTEQDQIMFDISKLTEEIVRLQNKQEAEGLSNYEWHTLKGKQKDLKDLRRKIWNSGH